VLAYGLIQTEASAMYTVGLTVARSNDRGVQADQETAVRMAAQLLGQLLTLVALPLWLYAGGFTAVCALAAAVAITGLTIVTSGGAAAFKPAAPR
jgi:hypothetical protein